MKKLTMAFVLAMVIVSLAITDAFAGPHEVAEKRDPKREETGPPKQRPGNPQDAARNENRQLRDKTIRNFQNAVRDAEIKFKKDEKAASKLQGDERKAAMQKTAGEMKATIIKAETDKDAALEALEPGRNHARRKKKHLKNDGEATQNNSDKAIPDQTEKKLKPEQKIP